jgi:hypothetical protein
MGFVEDLRVEGWSFLSRGSCKLRLGHCPDALPRIEVRRPLMVRVSSRPRYRRTI